MRLVTFILTISVAFAQDLLQPGHLITGEIVDGDNRVIGDLYDIEVDALETWEREFRGLGLAV